jgi:hemerythrin superfamily protein
MITLELNDAEYELIYSALRKLDEDESSELERAIAAAELADRMEHGREDRDEEE